jgi:hypothetical protein
MNRAKVFVPAGGSFQVRAGDMFLPMQEYFAGMDCPFANASLFSARDMSASEVGVEVEEQDESRMANIIELKRILFIGCLPV